MGEDLVAAVAAGGEDRVGGEPPGELGDRARVRVRSEAAVELGHVDRADAVVAEAGRSVGGARTGHQRLDRRAAAEPAGERERLQRQLVRLAAVVLHEDENAGHHATPSLRNRSTTAGAASAPSPSSSAWRPRPGGTVSRTISSRGSAAAGSPVSTGLRRARSFAGTDG